MKKIIFSLCTFLTLGSLAETQPEGYKEPKSLVSEARIPIQVRSSISSSVPPNADTPVTMEVMIEQDCTGLKIGIRGIDGMKIKGGKKKSYAECKRNTSVLREVKIKVPKDTLAYAVVDVDMTVAGMKLSQSLPIAFGSGRSIPKKKSLGASKKDASGKMIRSTKAQEIKN